jgi:hypothetical protein
MACVLLCRRLQVAAHGLSFQVDRLTSDMEGLLSEPLSLAHINNTRLGYLMAMGQGPIEAGLDVLHAATLNLVDQYYHRVDQLHVAALVLSWALAFAFVGLQLRPFLKRNKGETNRIAKMLSQLPAEVDIESLVQRLLLSAPAQTR